MGWREDQKVRQRAEYARLVRAKLCVACYEPATAGVRCKRCRNIINHIRKLSRLKRKGGRPCSES